MKNQNLTEHAAGRVEERGIPNELIQRAILQGKRTLLIQRNAIEYKLKNILGMRGINLIVITGINGIIITSYAEKIKKTSSRKKSY